MSTTNSEVQSLYIAYFGRPADPAGLNYWTQTGTNTLQQQSNAFATAPEWTTAIAGMTNDQIVNLIYINAFGRAPEPAGLRFWSDAITDGTITVGTAAWQIVTNTGPADKIIVDSKIAACTGYTASVTASTADSLAYSNTAAFSSANTWLDAITTPEQATAALVPATLDATLAAMVTASNASTAQTFTLTTGVDTLGTGAFVDGEPTGNSVINSTDSGVTQTWTALDSITATGANNTFNLATSLDVVNPAGSVVTGVQTMNVTQAGDNSVILDTTAFTGLTTLNVTTFASTEVTTLTAAATTNVALIGSVANSTPVALEVNGGGNVTVTAVGSQIVVESAAGAVVVNETAQGANAISIDGGTTVNVTSSGVSTGTITVGGTTAPTGAVVVNTTTSSAGGTSQGDITVTGGTTITVSQNKANAVNTTTTAGAVTVTGSALTTAVSVSDVAAATASATVAGRINNTVTVTDVNYGTTTAGTITAITASGYTTLDINDSALTTLSVANGSGNIIIDNSDAVAAPVTTLAVTVNGLTGGTLDDADVYTTLNVTTATANSTLANITTGAVTTLNVTGPNLLTVNSVAGLSAVTTITSGAGGLSLGSAIGTGVTYTGGTGNDTLTVGATTKAVNVGTGNNSVTVSVSALGAGGTITSGSGTNDTLTMSAADAATASGTSAFATAVTGFENLVLTSATSEIIDLAVLGNYTKVSTSGGNGLTLNNFANNSTLTLTGAGTAYTLGNAAFTSGVTDVVNLVLTDGSAAGIAFAATGITAANVETIAITTADTQAVPSGTFLDTVTLLGNSATSITVAGNAGLNLTATDTALTSLNASGITLGDFTFSSGALAAAATVSGSATGTNDVSFALAATAKVTYTGGTGDDNIVLNTGAFANVLSLGDGTNIVTGASTGANTITGGAGADTFVTGTTGNNIINFGNGANEFLATTGNNTYTGGTGVDTVTVGGGVNTITSGTGADVIEFTAVVANGNAYSTITDAHATLEIVSASAISPATFDETQITLPSTAAFADYLNAASAADGSLGSVVSWFQYLGNTYIVEDNAALTTFSNGVDSVIQLTGLQDLSNDTFVAATGWSLTLV